MNFCVGCQRDVCVPFKYFWIRKRESRRNKMQMEIGNWKYCTQSVCMKLSWHLFCSFEQVNFGRNTYRKLISIEILQHKCWMIWIFFRLFFAIENEVADEQKKNRSSTIWHWKRWNVFNIWLLYRKSIQQISYHDAEKKTNHTSDNEEELQKKNRQTQKKKFEISVCEQIFWMVNSSMAPHLEWQSVDDANDIETTFKFGKKAKRMKIQRGNINTNKTSGKIRKPQQKKKR